MRRGGATTYSQAEECCWLTSNPNFLSLPATVPPPPPRIMNLSIYCVYVQYKLCRMVISTACRMLYILDDILMSLAYLESTPTLVTNCSRLERVIFQPRRKENPIYVFPEKELCGLSPNFHIHVSVSNVHIYSQNRSTYFPAAA